MSENIETVEKFQHLCEALRGQIKSTEKMVRDLDGHPVFQGRFLAERQLSEIEHSLRLSIDHLEDARMRLGKVIQYSGDGVSIYDKKKQEEEVKPQV